MSLFQMYLELGFGHILDFRGYDHILFVSTLCAVYHFRQWNRVLVLVTAFTAGHSITLALATLRYISFSNALIEFLIPLTIFLTAFSNFFNRNMETKGKYHWIKYFMALFFGLIHGLGFSNYLRSLLGMEESIVMPLFAFNIGLEGGQILIVLSILMLALLVVDFFRVARREWSLILSGAGLGISMILMIERLGVLLNN